MSRVYRYEEIIDFVPPTPEIFEAELTELRAGLSNLHAQGDISGALIWGSATYGAANPRSDIDVWVSASEITPSTLDGLRDLSTAAHQRSWVPVDFSCFTDSQLRGGEVEWFRTPQIKWMQYLSAQYPQNVIGTNPVEIVRPSQSDLLMSIDQLLAQRQRELSRAYLEGSHPNPEGLLEQVLNAPHKLGRDVIAALQEYNLVPAGTLTNPSKQAIAEAVLNTLGRDDPGLAEMYLDLSHDFHLYTKFLEEVTADGIDASEYAQIIAATLDCDLPKALTLVNRMQSAYRARITSDLL